MSSTYGAVGTNPLSDLPDTPEHLIANLLKNNWDESITGLPLSAVLWEQWYEGEGGDVAFYFQWAGEFDISDEIDWNSQKFNHYTDIHIFARSLRQDYAGSADLYLFKIYKWVRKVCREQRTALQTSGIEVIELSGNRMLAADPEVDDTKKMVISLKSKIRMVFNA